MAHGGRHPFPGQLPPNEVYVPAISAEPHSSRAGHLANERLDLALQVLDNVIMTRWKVLPREQCQGEHLLPSLKPPVF